MKKSTAILKKCNESDKKPGRPWCIYDHDSKGGIKKNQGKGWPKTYKNKKDAEKALGVMKMFSSSTSELGAGGLNKLSIKAQNKEELVEAVIEKLLNLKNPKEVDSIFKEYKLKNFNEIEKLSEPQLKNILKQIKLR
jgi:hypothetical protein